MSIHSSFQLLQEPVKSAEEVIKEIDDMIEGDETDDEDGGDVTPSAGATSGAMLPTPLPSYTRSSRIVSEALAGRKLEELSANELTQVVFNLRHSDSDEYPITIKMHRVVIFRLL